MKLQELDPHFTTYEPIGDKVLLALPSDDSKGFVKDKGVLVPEDLALKATPLRDSVVIAAGPDCKQVKKGDTVRWNKLNATPFPEGEHDLYFLPEPHLICIIERAPERGHIQATD